MLSLGLWSEKSFRSREEPSQNQKQKQRPLIWGSPTIRSVRNKFLFFFFFVCCWFCFVNPLILGILLDWHKLRSENGVPCVLAPYSYNSKQLQWFWSMLGEVYSICVQEIIDLKWGLWYYTAFRLQQSDFQKL